jgi:hypothetical protein
MEDKWRKVRIGLLAASGLAPCHLMIMDADDLASNRLAGHVALNPTSHGWYFDQGWMYDNNSHFILKRWRDFDKVCGSSSIIRFNAEDFPKIEKTPNVILDFGHSVIREAMVRRGTPLKPLPFAGAIYVLNTGENDSGFSLKNWRSKKIFLQKLLNYRFVTYHIREEFSLYL